MSFSIQQKIILAESICIKHYLYKKYIKKKTNNFILKNRKTYGEFYHLYRELRNSNETLFYTYTRMSIKTFDYIVECIRPEFNLNTTNFQVPIPVEERLLLTLR